MKFDVCIIGGGAAGLAAAATLDGSLKVCVIEKNKIPGRKIMATGGGKCNLTNRLCVGHLETLGFFASMGLETREDEAGRFYPYSGRASDVADILVGAASKRADIICGQTVERIRRDDGGPFAIETGDMSIDAENVILATGGKAAPQFGTIGEGYKLAVSLGHSTTRIYPILTGVECCREGVNWRKLKGIRARGRVSLLKNDIPVRDANGDPVEETGEIQFTEYGISGICVYDLTPYIKAGHGESFRDAVSSFSISLDLAPDMTEEHIASRGCGSAFGIVTAGLAEAVSCRELKHWKLEVTGIRGWREAQCTAGGIALEEIDPDTMGSRITGGLYLAGEIIDRQGPCGGFNLQNAWETGIRAAKAINGKYARRASEVVRP